MPPVLDENPPVASPELSGAESPSRPLERVPLDAKRTRLLVEEFHRDGVVRVGRLLDDSEVAAFKDRIDRVFADPRGEATDTLYSDFIATRLFEHDHAFRDLLAREPMISLMEAILGADCHVVANNVVRNKSGQGIDTFHADDFVWFPLPEGIPRHDPRLVLPVFMINAHIALTDIGSDEDGPLQWVPGSHYSGRNPNDAQAPTFEGRGVRSMHCRAGDLYLQHPQVWHRGALNHSHRTRYVLGCAYGRRFVAQRFYPFLNYRMPDHVLAGADERTLRLLGKHPKGPYG